MPNKEVEAILVGYETKPTKEGWDISLKFQYHPGPLFNHTGHDFFTHVFHEYKTSKKGMLQYDKYLKDGILKKVSLLVDNKINKIVRWKDERINPDSKITKE